MIFTILYQNTKEGRKIGRKARKVLIMQSQSFINVETIFLLLGKF